MNTEKGKKKRQKDEWITSCRYLKVRVGFYAGAVFYLLVRSHEKHKMYLKAELVHSCTACWVFSIYVSEISKGKTDSSALLQTKAKSIQGLKRIYPGFLKHWEYFCVCRSCGHLPGDFLIKWIIPYKYPSLKLKMPAKCDVTNLILKPICNNPAINQLVFLIKKWT